MADDDRVNVRHMVDRVAAAVDFYTTHFGFSAATHVPAFADIIPGSLRLLLAGRDQSAGRPMADGAPPGAGGWDRIHFVVGDFQAAISRLSSEGVRFRNEVVTGPSGSQVGPRIHPPIWSGCSSRRDADVFIPLDEWHFNIRGFGSPEQRRIRYGRT